MVSPSLHMSGKRGSNPRPLAWEANALPTELLPRSACEDTIFSLKGDAVLAFLKEISSLTLTITLYPLQATSCHFLSYTTILQEILFNAVKVVL